MAQQEEIDDLTTALNTAGAAIENEISELEKKIAEGVPTNDLDLTALKAEVATIGQIPIPVVTQSPTPGSGSDEQEPAKSDGTSQTHTTDPNVAKQQEDAARANV